jgi:hypothetical protein
MKSEVGVHLSGCNGDVYLPGFFRYGGGSVHLPSIFEYGGDVHLPGLSGFGGCVQILALL